MLKPKTIFLTGGGTGGSVTPLLAIAERLYAAKRDEPIEFVWVGSKDGPEQALVENLRAHSDLPIAYQRIAYGKLRRYFSLANFSDIFRIIIGFGQSLALITRSRPALILSAGSYISVPVVWAGAVLRVSALIHQQDLRPGLANKLMAPFCRTITTTFEKSLADYGAKAVWTGNLIRPEFISYKIDRVTARQKVGFNNVQPVVFAIGGGTGAESINDLVEKNIKALTAFCQVIHVTGPGKGGNLPLDTPNYRRFEFMHIDGLIKAYAASDIVISRAGMGVLSELAFYGKPTIVIPMPDSHQEDNAHELSRNEAAVVLEQKMITSDNFVKTVKQLLADKQRQQELGNNLKKTIRIDRDNQSIALIADMIK